MAITDRKITAWTNPIASEADRPQRTASDMKAVFDSNSIQLKESLNGLIDDLAPTVASAAKIKTDQGDARFLRGDGQYAIPATYEATNGVPSGGTPGQILKKNGAADFSAEWADASLLPAATPTDLPLVSDANRGAQTKTAAEMRAILGAQATLTPGTDYAIPAVDIAATLSTTWTGSAAPYTQSVDISGMTTAKKIQVGLAASCTSVQYAAAEKAKLLCTAQSAGAITITAFGTKPAVALPIVVRVVG